MDWANERYVRVYTRDTTTWKLLDWRARTVLMHLFRKVDRAGVLEVDGAGVEGLAAVLELPLEIVEPGIAQLTDPRRGVVVESSTAFVIPNFLEAQEAVQTEAHRSREYRARKRERAMSPDDATERHAASQVVTKRDAPITKRDETVTPHHATSRDVTPIRSEPILSGPTQDPDALAARAPAIPPVPVLEQPQRLGLNHRTWDRLNAMRKSLALELGLPSPLHLAEQDIDRRELASRISESPNPEREIEHVLEMAELEARTTKSLQFLSGSLFSERVWRRKLAQTSDDAARPRAGPPGVRDVTIGRVAPATREVYDQFPDDDVPI